MMFLFLWGVFVAFSSVPVKVQVLQNGAYRSMDAELHYCEHNKWRLETEARSWAIPRGMVSKLEMFRSLDQHIFPFMMGRTWYFGLPKMVLFVAEGNAIERIDVQFQMMRHYLTPGGGISSKKEMVWTSLDQVARVNHSPQFEKGRWGIEIERYGQFRIYVMASSRHRIAFILDPSDTVFYSVPRSYARIFHKEERLRSGAELRELLENRSLGDINVSESLQELQADWGGTLPLEKVFMAKAHLNLLVEGESGNLQNLDRIKNKVPVAVLHLNGRTNSQFVDGEVYLDLGVFKVEDKEIPLPEEILTQLRQLFLSSDGRSCSVAFEPKGEVSCRVEKLAAVFDGEKFLGFQIKLTSRELDLKTHKITHFSHWKTVSSNLHTDFGLRTSSPLFSQRYLILPNQQQNHFLWVHPLAVEKKIALIALREHLIPFFNREVEELPVYAYPVPSIRFVRAKKMAEDLKEGEMHVQKRWTRGRAKVLRLLEPYRAFKIHRRDLSLKALRDPALIERFILQRAASAIVDNPCAEALRHLEVVDIREIRRASQGNIGP